MSVLVFVDHTEGSFKKKAYEAVNYAKEVASKTGGGVTAITLGKINDDELKSLGQYGADTVLNVADERLNNFNAKAYAKAIEAAAQSANAQVIVTSFDTVGKSVSPIIAAQLKAGLVAGAIGYPVTDNGFVVKKNVFSGKAFANVKVNSATRIISIVPNTFPVAKTDGTATVQPLSVSFDDKDFGIQVKEVNKVSGQVPLTEAELVVSGGRGLKGPENWGILEDLANALGASLACSRPVADAHWRPHHEHVGQTGGTIRPNLYIAVGISGAIQHLAGVNGSKTIVVINKDAEAPFFKAADYGVVGDAFEIVPKLTEAVKKFKAAQ